MRHYPAPRMLSLVPSLHHGSKTSLREDPESQGNRVFRVTAFVHVTTVLGTLLLAMRYGSVKAKTKQSDSFPSYKINATFAQKGGRQ